MSALEELEDKIRKGLLEMVIKDEAYNKDLNDAWELIKKLTVNDYRKDGYDSDELQRIFGTENLFCILKKYTPQEALAKLEAYENEIKVGDVVEIESTKECYVILAIYGKIIWGYSCEGNESPLQELDGVTITKTGKHIDISKILEQIGE